MEKSRPKVNNGEKQSIIPAKQSFRAILLDFDDTLMATKARRESALIKATADLGFKVVPEDITPYWGKPFDKLIEGIAPGISFEQFYEHYAEVMLSIPSEILPGVHDLLVQLAKMNVPMLIISSGSNRLVQQDLEQAGLLKYVSKLWGYEETLYHKPDPRTLDLPLKYISNLGIEKSCVLYIGDSVADYAIARSNNLIFYAVLTGQTTKNEFKENGLDESYIFKTIEGILRNCFGSQQALRKEII